MNDNAVARAALLTAEEFSAIVPHHSRLSELAETHPLLFSGLATGYCDDTRRYSATKAALAGKRLRTVCELAGMPYCLRSLPPQLCPIPLPAAEWSTDASPVLTQFIPEDAITLSNWVPGVFFANGAAGEHFALWLAGRHSIFARSPFDPRCLMPIAMFNWFVRHPRYELHTLVPRAWSPRAGLKRLLSATRAWLYRIRCRVFLPDPALATTVGGPYAIGPFLAHELRECAEVLGEQQAMNNCLDRYGQRIGLGTFAVFSLRTADGVIIANFEVAIHDPKGPSVTEIRGRSNAEVCQEIRSLVEHWVATTDVLRRAPVDQSEVLERAHREFAALVEPYVWGHQAALSGYGAVELAILEKDLQNLGARVGITNWPVRYEACWAS